jgi:hypothetical protein
VTFAAIAIGTVAGWASVVTIIIVGLIVWRGGGGFAVQQLQLANEVMEKRIRELELELKNAMSTIEMLRARTDVTEVVRPLIDTEKALVQAVLDHERQAANRSDKILGVLDLIAAKLGPDS